MKGRIIVVAVGLAVLLIIFVIIMSILGNAGKGQNQAFIEIAQRQTEIIRLSTLAEQKAKVLETRSYATTVRMSFTTAQSDMTSVLASHGVNQKSLSKQLSASKNAKSDQALTEAEKNNRFDETWTELINTEINNYKKQLTAAAGGSSPQDTQTLQAALNQANTLQGTVAKQ